LINKNTNTNKTFSDLKNAFAIRILALAERGHDHLSGPRRHPVGSLPKRFSKLTLPNEIHKGQPLDIR